LLAKKKLITLEKAIAISKASKKKIGLTNGCFDILHIGHCKLFEEAKSLCEILIVGTNTDKTITKKKGDSRPINNKEFRMDMLSHNKDIDLVFSFPFKNAYRIVEMIRPDIYIQGAEYRGLLPKEEKICNIHYIDKDDNSVTNIIRKIKDV